MLAIVFGSIRGGIPAESAGLDRHAPAPSRLSLRNLKDALLGTIRIKCMIMLIVATACGYGQLLGYSGQASAFADAARDLRGRRFSCSAGGRPSSWAVLKAVPLMLVCLPRQLIMIVLILRVPSLVLWLLGSPVLGRSGSSLVFRRRSAARCCTKRWMLSWRTCCPGSGCPTTSPGFVPAPMQLSSSSNAVTFSRGRPINDKGVVR